VCLCFKTQPFSLLRSVHSADDETQNPPTQLFEHVTLLLSSQTKQKKINKKSTSHGQFWEEKWLRLYSTVEARAPAVDVRSALVGVCQVFSSGGISKNTTTKATTTLLKTKIYVKMHTHNPLETDAVL
jgi:nucleosome binding factor SPN SPT16 subunit